MKTGIALLTSLALVGVSNAAFPTQTISRRAGLPSAQVHGVVEDHDGNIWVAGPSGLVRYDGVRLVTFARADGLSTQGLRALAVTADGSIWVGTDEGVDRIEPDGAIGPVVDPESWKYGFVDSLASVGNAVWIGTTTGILRWDSVVGLEPQQETSGHLVTALLRDRQRLWATGPTLGLRFFEGEGWQAPENNGWRVVAPVTTVASGLDGAIFVGGQKGLAMCNPDGSLQSLLTPPSENEAVTAILMVGDELWAGAHGELRLYRHEKDAWTLDQVIKKNILVNEIVRDSNDNIWIATDSSGLEKISALRHAVSVPEIPCRTQVYSVREARNGDLLIGGEQCSWQIDGVSGELRSFDTLDRVKVWDLVEDRVGDLWAATDIGLFRRAANGVFSPSASKISVLEVPGRALLDRDDGLWIGTVSGLARVENSRQSEIVDPGGQSFGYVYTLEEDRRGRLWVGTIGRGLWRETDAGVLQPVIHDSIRIRGNVYSISFADDGRVAVIQDERIVVLDSSDGHLQTMTGGPVAGWSSTFTDRNELWVGAGDGLVLYDLSTGAQIRRLTSAMGLAGDEFTTSRSLYQNADGLLFCGMDSGLAVVDPVALDQMEVLPEVRLSEAVWRNTESDRDNGMVVVGPGRWQVDFYFSSPWFTEETSLMFRHRLIGYDETWSDPRPRAAFPVQYTGLPAGRFELEAQAFSPLLGWGPKSALLEFQVQAPWWRRWWMYPIWTLVVASLVTLLWRWRIRRLLTLARILEMRVRQSTLELRAANQELKRVATHDHLTGLPNQRNFWARAEEFLAIARRRREPFGLIMFDIDLFKGVNDSYGHRVGDRALIHVASSATQVLREGDVLSRYGGEEFVILLAHDVNGNFREVAERVRRQIEDNPFVLQSNQSISITASFGVTRWHDSDRDADTMVIRADTALYSAKQKRNAVVELNV